MLAAVEAASGAVRRGELAVIPTDTVYGIAADAFDPAAGQALLAAKGRGRDMPPPVLIGSAATLDALATEVPAWVRPLVQAFWPGPLTLVCHQQSSLQWDLGETRGTVGVRMPDHELALAVLERTGPMAVSSANRTGMDAATEVTRAADMLGDRVSVIVDGGPTPGTVASTILDCTGARPRLLRAGVLSVAEIDAVLAGVEPGTGPALTVDTGEESPADTQADSPTGTVQAPRDRG